MPSRLGATIALVVAASGCAPLGSDPVTTDPPVDHVHPAGISEDVVFTSGRARMNGIVYVAGGAGPHPTAILLHGFPGNERNLDLAHAIRRAGWNAVFFHYRGAWGSEGEFSFSHALDDVAAVVRQVRMPAFAATHRVDPDRIALVGHSMGGFAALVTASEQSEVRCAVSVAGANLGALGRGLGDPAAVEQLAATLERWGSGPLRSLPGPALVAELRAQADRFDTIRHAGRLAEKPLLLVGGARDEVTPVAVHHDPLVATIEAWGAGLLQHAVLDADHAFSDRRIALARQVVGFLKARCR